MKRFDSISRHLFAAVLFVACFAASRSAAAPGITVANGNLALEGQLYVPNGVQIVGFVAPEGKLKGPYVTARQHWGPAELEAAKRWGADLIRFQLSICGLDPQSEIHDPNYVAQIESAMSLARSRGFNVILSLQHQSPSGCATNYKMPVPAVQRAWQALAPRFNRDPYVVYEMFNEPELGRLSPTATDWETWLNGDASQGYVGHQQVLDTIRATGATNVVLADGLALGKTFNNAPTPLLRDPLGQVAYAVHTYFAGTRNDEPAEWDKHFGDFHAAGHAVVGTEWTASSKTPNATPDYPKAAARLIPYLRARNIGNVGFAFDLLNTIIVDWNWNPTSYNEHFTSDPNGTQGPGQLIKGDYLAHPSATNSPAPRPPQKTP